MSSVTIGPCVGCCSTPIACAGLECRIRGGTATLCGHSEYVSPSTPPKKYRKKTFDGVLEGRNFSDSSCVTSVADSCFATMSGASEYSSTTCSVTHTGLDTRTGSCSGTFPITSIPVFAAGGDSEVLTQTVRSSTNDFLCHNLGFGTWFRRPSIPTAKETLSDEDTNEDAVDRLLAGGGGTWGSWITSGAVGCTGTPPSCCLARWETRISGFSFIYQEAQFRSVQTGLTPGTSYSMDFEIYRRAFGSGSYALFQTLTLTATADGSGNATFEADVPNEEGFESYATC